MLGFLRAGTLLVLLFGTLVEVSGLTELSPHHRHAPGSRHSEVRLPHNHRNLMRGARRVRSEDSKRWQHLKDTWIKKPPKLTESEIRDLVRVLIKKNVPVKKEFKSAVRRVMSVAAHNNDWEGAQKFFLSHPEYFGKNPVPLKLPRKHRHHQHHEARELEHPRSEAEFDRAFGNRLETFDRQWRRHSKRPRHNWFSMSKQLPEDDE